MIPKSEAVNRRPIVRQPHLSRRDPVFPDPAMR